MSESNGAKRYVRLVQLVGRPERKGKPGGKGKHRPRVAVPAIIPMSAASVWRAVKQGDMPPPVKLRPGITAWDLAEIEKWMAAKKVAA